MCFLFFKSAEIASLKIIQRYFTVGVSLLTVWVFNANASCLERREDKPVGGGGGGFI